MVPVLRRLGSPVLLVPAVGAQDLHASFVQGDRPPAGRVFGSPSTTW